jgi:hypothetical protein
MMSEKTIYLFASGVGATVFGYAPSLFGAGPFSLWGVLGSVVGGLGGIYLAYKWLH